MTQDLSKIKSVPLNLFNKDYAWGLAVLDLVLQSGGDKLQVGIMFRNSSDGPIRYKMEKFECKIADCIKTAQVEEPFRSCVVARDCNNLYYSPMLTRVSAAPKPQITGALEFVAVYGHPDWEPVRRMHMIFNMVIISTRPPQPPQIMPSIQEHDEEAIKTSIN